VPPTHSGALAVRWIGPIPGATPGRQEKPMIRTTLACLVALGLMSGAAAQERPKAPQGEPPVLCTVMMLGEKTVRLKGPGATQFKCDIIDLEFQDAAGKKLTEEEFRKRAAVGSTVVVASDEKKIDPAYLGILKPDTAVVLGATVVLARDDKPGRGWTLDLKKMTAGGGQVVGKVFGADFKPDKIQLQNTGLSLRTDTDNIHLFLRLKPGQGIAGKSFEWSAEGDDVQDRPHVHVHIHSAKPIGTGAYTKGYAMKLEFGAEKDGTVPGKIYLCLPDEKKSWIAGSFTIDLR
jgi:hypothetical protein